MVDQRMLVNGEMVKGNSIGTVRSPATGEVVGTYARAGVSEVTAALRAAQVAVPMWSSVTLDERLGWMQELRTAVIDDAERLRHLVHLETGKPWAQTEEDHASLVNSLEFFANAMRNLEAPPLDDRAGTHSHHIRYEPVGVVGAFLAWNFPLLNLAFKLGPAMAAGCPIIVKPSEKTPLSTYAVGELCSSLGLPPGVVNVICGADDVVGDGISGSTIPAMLTVIGSTGTGRRVMSQGSSSIKRYSMELGGNAPAIVFPDADLDIAVRTIGDLKFGNAGQTCVSPNRVFVHESIIERFTDQMLERAESVRVGFDRNAEIDMGPVIERGARDRIEALVAEAVGSGAQLLTGGTVAPGTPKEGHFLSPTVLTSVTPDMRIYREEIFGPVVSVIPFAKTETVIAHANDTDAGLASYVFTKDENLAEQVSQSLRFGEVQVNGVRYDINLPHGGIKQSGIGCDCSELSLHEYLDVKRISTALDTFG